MSKDDKTKEKKTSDKAKKKKQGKIAKWFKTSRANLKR